MFHKCHQIDTGWSCPKITSIRFFEKDSLIVISWLIISVSLSVSKFSLVCFIQTKVITLSGFHCTTNWMILQKNCNIFLTLFVFTKDLKPLMFNLQTVSNPVATRYPSVVSHLLLHTRVPRQIFVLYYLHLSTSQMYKKEKNRTQLKWNETPLFTSWQNFEQFLNKSWTTLEQILNNTRKILNQFLNKSWSILEQILNNTRKILNQFLNYLIYSWTILEQLLICSWFVLDQFLICSWLGFFSSSGR